MAKKTTREYYKMFAELGVEFTERQTGSGHIQFTVVHLGKSRKFTFGSTCSDHRAEKNNRAQVLRFLKDVENNK